MTLRILFWIPLAATIFPVVLVAVLCALIRRVWDQRFVRLDQFIEWIER